jgi:hypothetical protein
MSFTLVQLAVAIATLDSYAIALSAAAFALSELLW